MCSEVSKINVVALTNQRTESLQLGAPVAGESAGAVAGAVAEQRLEHRVAGAVHGKDL